MEAAETLFQKMKQLELENQIKLNELTYTLMIRGWSSLGDMLKARAYYEELSRPDRGIATTSLSFDRFISGLHSTGNFGLAETHFKERLISGELPTISTYHIMLEGLFKARNATKAQEILQQMIEGPSSVRPNIITYNIMINGLCNVGNTRQASQLFADIQNNPNIKPTEFTYNSLIEGYIQNRAIHKAHALFKEFLQHDQLSPDIVTYNTMIHGC